MNKNPAFRRWVSIGGTGAVFAAVLGLLACQRPSKTLAPDVNAQEKKTSSRDWPLFGGTVQRNLVNTIDKGIATDWSTATDKEKNIKWSVNLGSKAYGGPVISGGKIFVGTNNQRPKNKAIHGDKRATQWLREAAGNFRLQYVHPQPT